MNNSEEKQTMIDWLRYLLHWHSLMFSRPSSAEPPRPFKASQLAFISGELQSESESLTLNLRCLTNTTTLHFICPLPLWSPPTISMTFGSERLALGVTLVLVLIDLLLLCQLQFDKNLSSTYLFKTFTESPSKLTQILLSSVTWKTSCLHLSDTSSVMHDQCVVGVTVSDSLLCPGHTVVE